MNEKLRTILSRLQETSDFAESDFSDLNTTSSDGDNALHCVVRWGDLEAAKVLIEAGVEVNKAGDRGYTPLHVACMTGNTAMVKLLIDRSADLFALTEGDVPFATARLSGHENVCDLLAPLMKEAQRQDPKVWVRARIGQLQREISSLEKEL